MTKSNYEHMTKSNYEHNGPGDIAHRRAFLDPVSETHVMITPVTGQALAGWKWAKSRSAHDVLCNEGLRSAMLDTGVGARETPNEFKRCIKAEPGVVCTQVLRLNGLCKLHYKAKQRRIKEGIEKVVVCGEEGCVEEAFIQGLCQPHFIGSKGGVCRLPSCGKKANGGLGLCKSHYNTRRVLLKKAVWDLAMKA